MPHSSGSTPNEACSPANVGDHLVPNRKSATGTSPKNEIVSNSSEPTMQTVVRTDTKAAPISATLTPASNRDRGVGVRTSRTPADMDVSAIGSYWTPASRSTSVLDSAACASVMRDEAGRVGDRLAGC